MEKRALLINPWITDFAAYDFWLRPLGLLMIGASLRDCGVRVDMVDCLDEKPTQSQPPKNALKSNGTRRFTKTEIEKPEVLSFVPRVYGRYGISIDEFKSRVAAVVKPDVIIVTSSMTYWYPGAFEAIKLAREQWRGVPVMLGGRYATLCRDHAVELSGADFVNSGPPGAEFAKALSNALSMSVSFQTSFDSMPLPAHDLMGSRPGAAMAFSVGCPFNCSYCVSNITSGGFFQRTAEQTIAELKMLIEDLGARHIAFYDDAFLVNHEKLIDVALEHAAAEWSGVSFYNPNAMHARYLTEKTALLMRKAGFVYLRIGYESSDGDFQKKTGGKVTTEELKRALEYLGAAGFSPAEIGVYVICGHPKQDYDSLRRSLEAIYELGAIPSLAEYSPIPGSSDFEIARATFQRDPAANPVLQNSSVILFQHPKISRKQFENIKNECKEARIRAGANEN